MMRRLAGRGISCEAALLVLVVALFAAAYVVTWRWAS
jgi:hypothetical protein